MDCADFPIWESQSFCKERNKIWFCPKFHGAGLWYELGIGIQTGDIVWVNGPYPCGLGANIKIFNQKLKTLLLPFKKVMTDCTYRYSTKCFTRCDIVKWLDCENDVRTKEYMAMSRTLARHETVNGRMKEFAILRNVFLCDRKMHIYAFNAIAALT